MKESIKVVSAGAIETQGDAGEPNVKRPSKKRRPIRAVLVAITVVTVLVGALLFWLRPQGETYLAINSKIGAQPELSDKLSSIFAEAVPLTNEAFDQHAQLSQMVSAKSVNPLPRPQIALRNDTRLRRVIRSLGFSIKYKADVGDLEGEVDLLSFIEDLYLALGYVDRPVTVTGLQKDVPCSDGAGRSCWKLTASFGPDDNRLDDTLNGSETEIAADLAVFIMRSVVLEKGKPWRERALGSEGEIPPYLLVQNTPRRMRDMNATLAALRLLDQDCEDAGNANKRKACIDDARTKLETAIPDRTGTGSSEYLKNDTNAAAAMGLAMIALHDATSAARQGKPTHEIEQKLATMEDMLRRARPSSLVRAALESGDLRGFGVIFRREQPSNELFKDNAQWDLLCALAQHRRAQWAKCLEQLPDLDILPRPIRSHFEAAKFDAELYSNRDNPTEFARIHTALGLAIESYAVDLQHKHAWPLRIIQIRHACEGNGASPELDQLFSKLLDELPPKSTDWKLIAELEADICRGVDLTSETISARMDRLNIYPEGELAGFAFLEIARLAGKLGNAELAQKYMEKALAVPWAFDRIGAHPDYSVLDVREIKSRLYDVKASLRSAGDIESCGDFGDEYEEDLEVN